jgi:hypothetical protein
VTLHTYYSKRTNLRVWNYDNYIVLAFIRIRIVSKRVVVVNNIGGNKEK